MSRFMVDTVYAQNDYPGGVVTFKPFEGARSIKCDDLTFVGFSYNYAVFKCPLNKFHNINIGKSGLNRWNPKCSPKIYRENFAPMSMFSLGDDDSFFKRAGQLNQFGKSKTVNIDSIKNYTMFLIDSYPGRNVGTVYDGKLYKVSKTPFIISSSGPCEASKKIEPVNYKEKTIKIIELPNESLTIPIDFMEDLFKMLPATNTHGDLS